MTDFFPPIAEITSCIKRSRERRKIITEELKLTNQKDKGTLSKVEEMAIERTMEYMWEKKYWVLREQQNKGPADLYAYKIVNDERIEYFIDAKGIHPNAKQTPRFKPRADLKFINRDRVIRRIVSIVHNGKIKFVEGFHSNYKNLEEKYIKII